MTLSADDQRRYLAAKLAGTYHQNLNPDDFTGDWYDVARIIATANGNAKDLLDLGLTDHARREKILKALAATDPTPPAPPFQMYNMVEMWDQQAGLQKAWGGWLLLNNVTIIGGVSNVGKSPLLLAIVAGYLQGRWPDGSLVPEDMIGGNVVYCLPEGFGEQTEILLAWGLESEELARRVWIPALPTPGAPHIPNYIFKLDQDQGMACLEYYCSQVRPRLIVVDGLRAAMTGEESSSADADRFLAPLVRLANRYEAAIVLTHHLTKGSETASREGAMPSIDWFRGSGHIVAAARSCWIVDRPDANKPEERRITLVKAAAGPSGQQMGFTMGDPAEGLRFTQNAPQPPAKSKKDLARRWILQALRSGKYSHETLWEMCQEEDLEISESTFRHARVELSNEQRITQIIEGRDYYWALPYLGEQEPPGEEDLTPF